MEARQEGKTQKIAAAVGGFSERSAYRIEKQHYQPARKPRDWKTRPDPFDSVWDTELKPLLEKNPKLQAKTLLELLQEKHEGQYPDSLLRTLQRRIRTWKTLCGPEHEVIFRQNHLPGEQGLSDFTNANELGVTIRNEPFPHLIYHYRLACSGWEYAQVVRGGESFEALAEGLQNAFWACGGVPKTHRTDSLSAAYKNRSNQDQEDFTKNYNEFCAHYKVEPTRNNRGESHENGSIESSHSSLKRNLEQGLALRDSKDFALIDDYQDFLRGIMAKRNKRVERSFAEEKAHLQPLPERKTTDYSEERVKVTSSSTITVRQVTYSVPPRLIGHTLKVHLYDDRLECFVGGDHVCRITRLRKSKRYTSFINYRHIVGSLVRKPQAFRNYIYRDSLFPTPNFSQAWEYMDHHLDRRQACKEFVKILQQAAQDGCEGKIDTYLQECLASGRVPTSHEVQGLCMRKLSVPTIKIATVEPGDYDTLLQVQKEVRV